jgi:hypothetical protein
MLISQSNLTLYNEKLTGFILTKKMLTNENKFAFKIHKTLLDVGSEVIQLAIEHKIKETEPIPAFFGRHIRENNMNSRFLKDVKITLENYVRNNSNQYPNSLEIFDITSNVAIAQNLLNSANDPIWLRKVIAMDNLNFVKCLNNLRIIRNEFYGHLTCYQINESKYNEILGYLKILIKELVQSFDTNKISSYEQKIIEIQNILIISTNEFEKFKNEFEEQIKVLSEKYENLQTRFLQLSSYPLEPIPNFIGRTAILENIKEIFREKQIIILHSMSGRGKSAIANEYGWRLYNKETDFVINWMESDNDTKLYDEFQSFYKRFSKDREIEDSLASSYLARKYKLQKKSLLNV